MAGTHINYRTSGVFIISATPFDDTQSIDYSSLDSLLEFYIEKRSYRHHHFGDDGEAHKLTPEETRQLVLPLCLEKNGGSVTILVGVSNPDKDTLIELSAFCMDGGAAGIMVAPYSALDSDDKIYRYYADILSSLKRGLRFAIRISRWELRTGFRCLPGTPVQRIFKPGYVET